MPRRALFSACILGLGLSIAGAQPLSPVGHFEALRGRFTALEGAHSSPVEASGAMEHADRALNVAEAAEGPRRERALRIAEAAMNLAEEQALTAAQTQEIAESQRLVGDAERAIELARERTTRAEQALLALGVASAATP